MKYDTPPNWFLSIIQIYTPFFIWISVAVSLLLIVATFFFPAIYSASTALVVDASLARILKNTTTAFPVAESSDFIRSEYFATHYVFLMRSRDVAEKVITQHDIRDASGKPISPNNFLDPGLPSLVFSNYGNGVRIEWIVDTQMFSVTGYSRDPDLAVAYSRDYASFFLKESWNQFHDILSALTNQLKTRLRDSSGVIKDISQQIIEVKQCYRTADPNSEISSVIDAIFTAQDRLEATKLTESSYDERLAQLKREKENGRDLLTFQRTVEMNPRIEALKLEISSLTRRLVEVEVEYTHQHPEYLTIAQQLTSAKAEIKQEAEKTFKQEVEQSPAIIDTVLADLLSLTTDHLEFQYRVDHYQALIANYQKRLGDLVDAHYQIENIEAERQGLLIQKESDRKDIAILESMLSGESLPCFRIISQAYIDKESLKDHKYFPLRKKLLMTCLFGTLIFLSLWIFIRELHADKLYFSGQLIKERTTATVMEIPRTELSPLRDIKGTPWLAWYLRALFKLARTVRCIRVTSILPREGKSVIALTLAQWYSTLGDTVVIIDGDLEQATVSRHNRRTDADGLTDYLSGKAGIDKLLMVDIAEGVSLIARGTPVSEQFKQVGHGLADLIHELKARYDRIIFIDTPLALDRFLLAETLPTCLQLMVILSGKHTIPDVLRTTNHCSAIIVNQTPFRANIFSIQGLKELIAHLVKKPVGILRGILGRKKDPT